MGSEYSSNSATWSTRACACSEGEGLEIGEENAGAGDIGFRLLVDASMDGVVGTLEEQVLAVGDELNAGVGILRVEIFQAERGSTTEAVISSSTCTFSAG